VIDTQREIGGLNAYCPTKILNIRIKIMKNIKEQIQLLLQKIKPKQISFAIKHSHNDIYYELIKITQFLPINVEFIERIYCVLNDIKEHPKCQCGKLLNYRCFSVGYRKHCSSKCSHNDIKTLNKYKETNLNRYGVNNISQIKNVKEKKHLASLKKYGTDCVLQSKIVKAKIKNTCLKKYGVNHYNKTLEGRKFNRLKALNKISFQKNNGFPVSPFIGKNEIKFINELQQYCNYTIKQNINIDGYFPDGLIEELKLCIEYDEKHHNIKKQLKHDKIRNKYFKSIGYNIFRVKEKDWIENKDIILKSFIKFI
jgi:very-short-patch-repair endonuclease